MSDTRKYRKFTARQKTEIVLVSEAEYDIADVRPLFE
jgi:hypothetical protein